MNCLFRSDIQSFIPSIPKGDISWKNLDPFAVVNDIEAIFDIGTIKNFFERVIFYFL